MTKIGWIGLGKMGIPMSQQLIKAGYDVTVYNRNPEKENDLKALGAKTAPTPKELTQQTDIIFLMVTDDNAINEIIKGENGILGANATGKLIINMSTVSPAVNKEMAGLLIEQGNQYLDAPVSGSVRQAEDAALVIMVGGDQTAFEQAKPILETIGRLALHLGEIGSGNTAKLIINTMLAVYTQGLSEAVVFAQQKGISTENLTTLINNGALSSPFVKIKSEALLNENYSPAFTLKNIVKDLRLAKDIGLSTPLGETALQTFQEAEDKYGDEDLIAVVKHLTNKANR